MALGSLKISVVLGSVSRPGRLHAAVSWLLTEAEGAFPQATADLIDLHTLSVSFADGRPLDQYSDDTQSVVERVQAADGVLLATPIYHSAYSGALKNVLDLLPVEALQGKPVAMLGLGATTAYYQALESQLRPVLTWFGALTLPVGGYLAQDQFTDGQLSDEEGRSDLLALYGGLVGLCQVTADDGPSLGLEPLTIRRRR